MKKKSYLLIVMASVLIAGSIMGCSNKQAQTETTPAEVEEAVEEEAAETVEETIEETEKAEASEGEAIKIVYTNDVHSYIDNVVKDKDGNITGDGLRFSKVAAMVEDMRDAGDNVILVDAGDEIQGNIYGAMDEGATIIDIMSAAGYQLATPGNHDFDYGVLRLLALAETADFQYVTCNFHSTKSREIIFADSKVFDIGGKQVAFVGVTTPEVITSSTPTYFQDETGEFIYTVDGIKDSNEMYISVQNAVDRVRDDVDYVIAIGHVGVGMDEKKRGISSEDIIANVTGLDAFIDGHSHTTMVGEKIKDKDGKDVVLTQTGSYLNAVGIMTLAADGSISNELVNEYDREDDKVAKLEQDWIQSVTDQLGEQIGTLDETLYICNPDDSNQRLIRTQELNAGDFTADSIYWFFNKKLELDCDVAIVNGGGIRAQTVAGELSYMSAKQVEPFGNMICLISTTGQEIVNALEMGVKEVGDWDDEWNAPAENGGFLHVAGLSFTVDASVASGIETDDNGMFKGVNGDYRVKDVKVYNRESGKYEPIDLTKEYTLGGINYILRNSGNGYSMFADDVLTVDYVGQDYVILAEYIKSFAKDGDYARVNTKNSPLSSYKGYMIDYENPYGAGRIDIRNINYKK